ncbi:MAG: hypothetical protein NC418_05500 [Muribaculaceae bacterium]|nr:hypothetical protein [Muribaculaceae bacterium]
MIDIASVIDTILHFFDRRDRKKAEKVSQNSANLEASIIKKPFSNGIYILTVSNIGCAEADNVFISLDFDEKKVIQVDLQIRQKKRFTISPSTHRCFEIWTAESGDTEFFAILSWADKNSAYNNKTIHLQF